MEYPIKILLKSFDHKNLKTALNKLNLILNEIVEPLGPKIVASLDSEGAPARSDPLEIGPKIANGFSHKTHSRSKTLDYNPKYLGQPTLIKKWTVLRSPHVDKKSREQFEMRIFKYQYKVILKKNETLAIFISKLKNIEIVNVQLTIEINHKSFFRVIGGNEVTLSS